MNDFNARNKNAAFVMAVGTLLNILLFGVKLWIGLAANNISILTDAINNLGDVLSCVLSLVCFVLIRTQRKSERYPHGFSRLENVSSFVMSLLIVLIGGYFFVTALNRLMLASLVVFKWTYFYILLGTVVVKAGMAVFYFFQNKKIHSDVLRCAMFDSVIDASITMMTVIGLILIRYVQLRVDGVFGIIVSTLMIVEGVKLFITNLRLLIGSGIGKEDKEKILDSLQKTEGISNVRIVDYHDYGPNEKNLLVSAVFTNNDADDIIKTTTDKILSETGIKIYFIYEVEHEN